MKTARVREFIERGKQTILEAQRQYEQREAALRRARVPVGNEEPPEQSPAKQEILKGTR